MREYPASDSVSLLVGDGYGSVVTTINVVKRLVKIPDQSRFIQCLLREKRRWAVAVMDLGRSKRGRLAMDEATPT